jgi:V8-like Glu-specific endopeptidase
MRRITPKRLLYTVDTCPGHSGSAISARTRSGRAIIGVHTAGILDEQGRTYGCARESILAPRGALNSGIRLTPAVVRAIQNPASARGSPLAVVRFP